MSREHPACPHCGQRMLYMRAGARLGPVKVKIFDAIKRAGAAGISRADIIESQGLEVGEHCLRAHVWQINEILERFGSDVRVTTHPDKMYKIIDVRRKKALAKEKRI